MAISLRELLDEEIRLTQMIVHTEKELKAIEILIRSRNLRQGNYFRRNLKKFVAKFSDTHRIEGQEDTTGPVEDPNANEVGP